MTIELKVSDMACSACAEAIASAVTNIDPNAKVVADPTTKLVKITTLQPEAAIKTAITAAGYSVG